MNQQRSIPSLAIVIPCYNEQEVLPETSQRLIELLQSYISDTLITADSYVLLVDDGSKDTTWQQIQELCQSNSYFKGLKLSRNFGHQNALLGGLYYATQTDIVVSVDADLQDDLNAIKEMVLKYMEGAEIVYGVRDDRQTDTYFKRKTAMMFYKFLSVLGVESVYNHADFRLMSQKSLEVFRDFKEQNIYLRGMIPMIGFPTEKVYYARSERFAGESKYNLKKMLSLAWNGISSLSIQPLRFVTTMGFLVFFLTIILSAYALFAYLFKDTTVGWASTVLPIYFLGGIQLLCIGLLGEYIAKIYKEVKQRPRFIVEKYLDKNTET
ncbi:MAG TPA: glycosyltransferase family 2 protein [Edaphocola sp.]|nr:glycosyltransferase family 2 protein [Edaphocola sp.]